MNSRDGQQVLTYTAVGSGTTFTGVTGGTGLLATADTVTQPMIGDNTTTTYDFTLGDANYVNTRPNTIDKSGRIVKAFNLAAGQAFDAEWANSLTCENSTGFITEVVSGTVDISTAGK